MVVDSSDLRSVARGAQRRFEYRRTRYLPSTWGARGGSCDERVGRFCTWYSEGEWVPEPEDPRIVRMREELLAVLDSAGRALPGDDWILGQRVWYRGETGRWADALAVARDCREATPWWCAALEGLALHGMGAYPASLAAFRAALDWMDPDRARTWRLPLRALDGEGRDLLHEGLNAGPSPEASSGDPGAGRSSRSGAAHGSGGGGPALPDSAEALLHRLWILADPLHLVEGNDRLTAHYARWTTARLRERARNPFRISWGEDLEELTVRHGWEMGWERRRSTTAMGEDQIVGHKHPEGRDYIPPGEVLARPARAAEAALVAGLDEPRSLYAPAYAPVLLPMEGMVAVFPRADSVVVVATQSLPEDTTWHAGHHHPRPWMEAGDQAGHPDRRGLHLVSLDPEGRALGVEAEGTSGALLLRAPAGRYVVSSESWSPEERRAGRLRRGLDARAVPADVVTVSDLLLVEAGGDAPERLEEAAGRALLRPVIRRGETFGVVWEVGGLGCRVETISYGLAVERADRGLFRRAGEWLGLLDRERPLSLRWEEQGPELPGPALRWLSLDLPPLEAGEYRIRLTVDVAGRSALTTERAFRVLRERGR